MNMDCHDYLDPLSKFLECPIEDLEQYYLETPKVDRWGGGTVEPAVAQLLYIMIRKLKPFHSVELGTNLGYSTFFIASAIKENFRGILNTFEIDQGYIDIAKSVCEGFSHTIFHHGSSLEILAPTMSKLALGIDFAFVDSSHEYDATKIEIDILKAFLSKGGIITFHDALSPSSGVTKVLDELQGWKMLRLPTQPNTGFGIIKR